MANSILESVSRDDIARCLRLRRLVAGDIVFDVRGEEGTNYRVRQGVFTFICSCGDDSGLCAHALWALATQREMKRLEKLDPATVTVERCSPGDFVDIFILSDDYTVFHHHSSSGVFSCSCPLSRSQDMADTCLHIQAVQGHLEAQG